MNDGTSRRPAVDRGLHDAHAGDDFSGASDVAARLRCMSTPFVLHSGDLRRHGELVETLAAPVVSKPAPTGEITRRLAGLLEA